MLKRSLHCITALALVAGAVALPACSSGHDSTAPAPAPAKDTLAAAPANGMTPPAWASNEHFVGRVSSDDVITLQVHLQMRNEAAANAELAEISNPESAHYGQFLSDDEFAAKYAPTTDDVEAVRAHLEANGLKVTYVPENRAYLAVEGSVGNVERAFSTQLGNYTVKNETKRAPMSAVVLPAAIAGKVAAVVGLATPAKYGMHNVRVGGVSRANIVTPKGAHPSATDGPTCGEWYGAQSDTTDPAYGDYGTLPLTPCGYRPAQVRNAYGFNATVRKGNDGKGQRIAIVDAFMSPSLLEDAQTYAANNDPDYPLADSQFEAMMAPGTQQPPDTGWYGEQTLDVEAVHAMAPGAHIVYVGAQSPSDPDLIAAINLIVSKRLASIVSNSYGMVEDAGGVNFVAWHNIATQAGLKGVGLYFSSGDNGDESTSFFTGGNPSADFPAALDNATAVGGTSLALDRTGNRAWETAWQTGVSFLNAGDADAGTPATWSPAPPGSWYFGAGGGTSLVYEQPSYQKKVVPSSMANKPGAPARVVPDVGMLADPLTGFLIGQTDPTSKVYSESVIGGTSLACPLFAGTMALAQQHADRKFGFSNPLLYKASAKGAFVDVLPLKAKQAVGIPGVAAATFDYHGADLSIGSAVGYDNVTGLGTPNGAAFLKAVK